MRAHRESSEGPFLELRAEGCACVKQAAQMKEEPRPPISTESGTLPLHPRINSVIIYLTPVLRLSSTHLEGPAILHRHALRCSR